MCLKIILQKPNLHFFFLLVYVLFSVIPSRFLNHVYSKTCLDDFLTHCRFPYIMYIPVLRQTLMMFVRAASILSGCMADRTKIIDTTSTESCGMVTLRSSLVMSH